VPLPQSQVKDCRHIHPTPPLYPLGLFRSSASCCSYCLQVRSGVALERNSASLKCMQQNLGITVMMETPCSLPHIQHFALALEIAEETHRWGRSHRSERPWEDQFPCHCRNCSPVGTQDVSTSAVVRQAGQTSSLSIAKLCGSSQFFSKCPGVRREN